MRTVNIHDAKTNRASSREQTDTTSKGPGSGFLKGRLSIPDDFDTMCQDEIAAMFDGGRADEGMRLLTADAKIALYSGPIVKM